jgi:hypothetical protein
MDEREFAVVRLMLREALISSDRLTRLARRFEQGHIPLVLQTLIEGAGAGRLDRDTALPVLVVSTVTLALLPQILHRLISAAGLPVAELLPDRGQTAHALFRVLLFGVAGPVLRAQEPSREA